MASYATNLNDFDLCQTAGNFSELSGHTSGAAPSATSENFWQDGIAVDQATGQATGTSAGMQCDVGSPVSWTASSNWAFLVWQKFDAGTDIDTWANGGMRIGIGSSAGNMDFFNALGSNFGAYPSGGWQNTAIDPEVTPDATEGTPTGAYQIIGSMPNMLAKITKGSPHVVDAIRYGRCDIEVIGTAGTFTELAAWDNTATRRLGLFYPQAGSFLYKGLLSLGTTAASLAFSDANKSIRIDDTPRVLAGFNKIEINNSGSSITWNTINIAGVQTSITGSAPVSKGDFEVVDNATVSLISCTFVDMGTFTFNDGTNPNTITDCIFRRCETITQGGATFDGCLITQSTSSIAMTVDDLAVITDCNFVSDGTGHAIDLGTIAATQTLNWNNDASGYAATDGSTGNETLLVNVASGQTLTINVGSGYSTPTVYNTGTGTVNVVSGQVTLTVTVKDINTGFVIQGARVYVVADSGGALAQGTVIIDKDLTDVNGQVSDTRSYSGNQPITGVVRYSTNTPFYKTAPVSGTISSASGLNITVQMIPDE